MQDNLVGTTIRDRYHLISELGRGGTGTTYRAKDLEAKRQVAIKVVSLKQLKDWKTIELIDREAKVLENLDCEGIPQYLDSFTLESDRDTTFYLVQALASGKPLNQWIEDGWKPSEKEVMAIAKKILQILNYLQSLTPPIFHRDIKPQNILSDRHGNIYLVDFGSVQDTYRHTVTGGSTVVGTFGYMAPEQFRGQANLSTDLYGLGATLIYLLTQQDPAELPEKKLKIDFRAAVKTDAFFSKWLDSIIEPATEARLPNATTALATLNKEQPLPQQAKPLPKRIRVEHNDNLLRIEIAPPGLQLRSFNPLALVILVAAFLSTLFIIVTTQLPNYLISPSVISLSWMIACLGWVVSASYLGIAANHTRLAFSPQRLRVWQGPLMRPYNKKLPPILYTLTVGTNISLYQIKKIEQKGTIALGNGKYALKFTAPSISLKVGNKAYTFGHGLHPQEQRQIIDMVTLFLWQSTSLTDIDINEIVGPKTLQQQQAQTHLSPS